MSDSSEVKPTFGTMKGTNTESQGTNAKTQGTNAESQGTNAESQGTNVESQGTNVESQGTNVESQGTNVESQGTNTEIKQKIIQGTSIVNQKPVFLKPILIKPKSVNHVIPTPISVPLVNINPAKRGRPKTIIPKSNEAINVMHKFQPPVLRNINNTVDGLEDIKSQNTTKSLTYINDIPGILTALKTLTAEMEKIVNGNEYKNEGTLRTKSNNLKSYEKLEQYMSTNVIYGEDAYIKASDLVANYNFTTNSEETKISFPRLMEQYLQSHKTVRVTKAPSTRNGITGTYYFGFTIRT